VATRSTAGFTSHRLGPDPDPAATSAA